MIGKQPRGKWRKPPVPSVTPPKAEVDPWEDLTVQSVRVAPARPPAQAPARAIEEEEAELPALEPMSSGEVASEPSKAIRALGPPNGSVRSVAEWAFQLAATQAYEASIDNTCSQERREIRVRSMLATTARLYPESLRQEAAREIRDSRRAVDDRKKNRRVNAAMEPAPAAAADNVIQFRGTRG